MAKQPRRKCKVCREWFHPVYSNVWWCCPEHGAQYALALRSKEKEKEQAKSASESKKIAKVERAAWRRRKAAVKPLKHWEDLTQRAVNDLRRESDLANGDGCISCGTHQSMEWQAGHYRTTAAASHLRYEPDNINLQCYECNVHKSGNIELYRINLVKKIGEARVVEMECDNRVYRWTREELETIRLNARAQLRELKRKEAA
ncbi:hypothetical protein M2371_001929 [Buttiauxella sp. BIGb0471]|uniref:recombination protein NinG n=1 Tax=Buttiauxella sp. BIGb0471 TaxID=2940597 RepID=UPI002168DDA8|nr:recombination protein NinG [Buttiauxella sp. BIGb0471]MCS3602720.1 hypothetical protein [Buttiauxella sp. BIGb0471]